MSPSQLAANTARLRRGLRTVTLSRKSRFEDRPPSPQTAIDAIPGPWASRFPPPLDQLAAGDAELFDDHRLRWGFERLGGIDGQRVVELGPLEGAHSATAQQAGAASVTAVEANREAFLKCLVTKELLGLDRCRFLCGDAIAYLEQTPDEFDLCIAVGFLYHMAEPVRALEAISKRASSLLMWTHVYDEHPIAATPLAKRFAATPETRVHAGFEHRVHRHRYGLGTHLAGFWGGTQPYSNWLTRDDLLDALAHFGFKDVETGFEEAHVHGPALALVARR